jgi:hypothetical protein
MNKTNDTSFGRLPERQRRVSGDEELLKAHLGVAAASAARISDIMYRSEAPTATLGHQAVTTYEAPAIAAASPLAPTADQAPVTPMDRQQAQLSQEARQQAISRNDYDITAVTQNPAA